MLRLHGDGDPSGRGEAFSMLRVSMKDIFVKAGEDYEQKLGPCAQISHPIVRLTYAIHSGSREPAEVGSPI